MKVENPREFSREFENSGIPGNSLRESLSGIPSGPVLISFTPIFVRSS